MSKGGGAAGAAAQLQLLLLLPLCRTERDDDDDTPTQQHLESLIFVGYTRQQQQQPEFFFGEIANLFDGDIIRFPFFFPPKTTTTTTSKKRTWEICWLLGFFQVWLIYLGQKQQKINKYPTPLFTLLKDKKQNKKLRERERVSLFFFSFTFQSPACGGGRRRLPSPWSLFFWPLAPLDSHLRVDHRHRHTTDRDTFTLLVPSLCLCVTSTIVAVCVCVYCVSCRVIINLSLPSAIVGGKTKQKKNKWKKKINNF